MTACAFLLMARIVSILVLVDAALRLLLQSAWNLVYVCFNPCFSGCRPATVTPAMPATLANCFNPCFSGCRLATFYLISPLFYVHRFQSLF